MSSQEVGAERRREDRQREGTCAGVGPEGAARLRQTLCPQDPAAPHLRSVCCLCGLVSLPCPTHLPVPLRPDLTFPPPQQFPPKLWAAS